MHRLWSWAKKHVGIIRPTGNTCKQILSYMTRFMLQIVSVVSSIQAEAVSLADYFRLYEKWLWFIRHFYEGCFDAKERFLEIWTWSWILAIIYNILHQTFLTSNPGPTLYRNSTVKNLNCVVKCKRKNISRIERNE